MERVNSSYTSSHPKENPDLHRTMERQTSNVPKVFIKTKPNFFFKQTNNEIEQTNNHMYLHVKNSKLYKRKMDRHTSSISNVTSQPSTSSHLK